jgi:hypothetical protein
MSRKAIVTTTINAPTEATRKYAKMEGWDFIVVGDISTPHAEYQALEGCTYLTPQFQETLDKSLSDMIGWKNIQRRNMGFVYANKEKYDLIATVDDDNIPFDTWGELFSSKKVSKYTPACKFFDPLSVTNYPHLWHRGFPMQHVHEKNKDIVHTIVDAPKFDIQANLWNGDPDVDAICRMVHAPECTFNSDWYFSDKIGPFNSQNTILSSRVLRDYFVFDKVGRMDDIFASYLVQKMGYKVVFGPATVYQARNEHDLTVDMKKEYIGYENVKDILENEDFIYKPSYERYREIMYDF